MSGLEYGNTRLRARRSRLLDETGYATLLGAGTLDRMLVMLSDTTYGAAVEAALPRFRGVRGIDEVLRRALAAELRAVQRFYTGCEVPALDLLLERWDLHNLRTILRAKALPETPADLDGLLVPAGRLSDAELSELADQPGVRPVLDLMVAWGLPSPEEAHRLAASWPEYQRTGDVAVLDREVTRAYAARLDAALRDEPGDVDPGGLLRAEIDQLNLMVALRTLQSRRQGEPQAAGPAPQDFLPGGRLRIASLEAVGSVSGATEVPGLLAPARLIPGWPEAVTAWASGGELGDLEEALQAAVTLHAVGLFRKGDPLSAAIPVAYVFAMENEVRNLRWIARAIAQDVPRGEVVEHLVVA